MVSVLDEYRRRLAKSQLAPDEAQLEVACRLDGLSAELSGYRAKGHSPRWRRLLGGANGSCAPRGLYIWGGVGRGKTMLMDLFCACVPLERKRRVHFHQFMQDVHASLHSIRLKQRSGHIWEDANPIAIVCGDIAEKAALLCFDEFQVTDIADAMILGRLFEALLGQGVVIVATSNTPPGELYRDGLNRTAFVPFIEILESSLEVVHLTSPRDYRLDRIAGELLYVAPLGPAADRRIDRLWGELIAGSEERARSLQVAGRELAVPRAAGGAARFSFAELCQRPLGPPDYIAVADTFHTVVLVDVPHLPKAQHNAARRLTILIDTLYDRRVRLIVSAATLPQGIYDGARADGDFARTISRLHEMCSDAYWQGRRLDAEVPETSAKALASGLAAGPHPG